jgi:hypothetical protein
MAKQAASFRNEFDELAREIDHPGESGTAREHALRELLRKYLPRRVEVDTGFVIDAMRPAGKAARSTSFSAIAIPRPFGTSAASSTSLARR